MDIELEKEKTGAWKSRRHSTDQAVALREKGILRKVGWKAHANGHDFFDFFFCEQERRLIEQ